LILGLLLARLALAAVLPLTEDEAYYRLWAQAPAFGYFDHPPMIAWWIWLGVHAAGDRPLGVRLAPALACALTSFMVYDLAWQVGGRPAEARRAAIWHNATLLAAAGGFLAVPDAPAALFWIACLSACVRALDTGSRPWWLVAGAAAGLASLSKYSALFLGPGVLIWLSWDPKGRDHLRTAGPWLALLVAAALFAVNASWNAGHHWLTFAKQFGRIAPRRITLRYLGEFLVTQVLLFNPLMAIFLARAGKPPTERRLAGVGAAPPLLAFVATSLPFCAYLLAHSLHDRIEAHWPAPVIAPLAITAAFAAGSAQGAWRRLRRAVPAFAAVVCAVAIGYLSLPLLGVPLRFDPALPLRGWPAFSRRLESLRRATGAAWVGTTSYGLAAQLLDEPAITVPVLQISERERWHGLVHGASADASRPGLLVDLTRRIDLAALRRCFGEVGPVTLVARGPPGEKGKAYSFIVVGAPRFDVVRDGCPA
jgi:4-amino-4-deoxy-L-arabinose transferase-like glycosyltransferase